MNQKSSIRNIDSIVLALAIPLATARATMFVYLHPDTSKVLGPAWIEILLWLSLAVAVLFSLTRSGQMADYLSLWRRNWLPALFIVLAFLSVLWSIAPVATWFASLELFFSTLVASYFGMRLLPEKLMDALFWFGAILLILSLALVFGAPPTGTMYWAPFDGAWRGVYWHRNHLASVAAFLSIVYFCRMILALKDRNVNGNLDAVLYVLAIVTLYFARSVTGFIVFIVLHAAVLATWVWLQVQHRLGKRHYVLILLGGALAALIVVTNLGFVFGILGRDTTLTGRVGLWSKLLEIASRHPGLGYGFGAVWSMESFREEIRQLAGWPSQPLIADNGFLDILLHLGVLGLVILAMILFTLGVRSIRYAISNKRLAAFFPAWFMTYALVANITFSLFAETEVFTWFLMIVVLFMTTPSARLANEAA